MTTIVILAGVFAILAFAFGFTLGARVGFDDGVSTERDWERGEGGAEMTNEQKFKTAEERIEAFGKICDGKECSNCILKDTPIGSASCAFHWLALEAENLEPCPFCGAVTSIGSDNRGTTGYVVTCNSCGYTSVNCESQLTAIAAHNRVARAVKNYKNKDV